MKNKSITPFVLAIIKKENKFLLTKRHEVGSEDPKQFQGMWQLPGGGVNYRETVENALIREVKEELGLDIRVIRMVPFINNSIRENWHGLGMIIHCELKDLSQVIKLNFESSEFGWFTYEGVMKLNSLPGVKEAVKASL